MQIGDYENLVFFDTETTGFDAKNNQIIELAAILVKSGEVAMQMDEFIKLPEGEAIPEKIVELTHITDEMLRIQGKSEETVLMMFAYMIAAPKTLLIAHNAQFDLNFIGQAFMRHREGHKEWLKAFCNADYLDTLTVFKDRRAYPHKLENAINCYHLEDKVVNSHRAVDTSKHQSWDLAQMQALPLSAKIRMTINRLRDAYDYYDGMLYVSRSGGKDSDVLGDIVKEHFSDIPHVFINTGLEDNSVRRHGIKIADVVLTPPMNFVDIITTYGYPVISKEIAGKFYDLQRAKENGTDSYVLKQLEGTYVSKNGKTNMIDIKKYAFLKDAPFRISNQCCIQSKEAAARKYEKETGRIPIVGTMATESMYRYQSWIKYGCNAFESKRPQSRPLSFWTEQDVLQYIKEHDLKIADAYGRVTYQDDAGLFYDNPFITDGLSLTTTASRMAYLLLPQKPNEQDACSVCLG